MRLAENTADAYFAGAVLFVMVLAAVIAMLWKR